MNMKITICGAGRGGKTMAADYTLMGHEVTLYESPQFEKSLDQIRSNGGSITLTGDCTAGKTGKAQINKLTTNAKEALSDAELIFTVLPGFGHELMYTTIIPHLKNGQIVVSITGYWSALRFNQLQKKHNEDVILAETEILPYLTIDLTPGNIQVVKFKEKFGIAALPASKNNLVMEKVAQLYLGRVYPMQNVLETDASNLNCIIHSPVILSNLAYIDNSDKKQS
jgi:opine dehydrogenase